MTNHRLLGSLGVHPKYIGEELKVSWVRDFFNPILEIGDTITSVTDQVTVEIVEIQESLPIEGVPTLANYIVKIKEYE